MDNTTDENKNFSDEIKDLHAHYKDAFLYPKDIPLAPIYREENLSEYRDWQDTMDSNFNY